MARLRSITEELSGLEIDKISSCFLYYLFAGRNAWYSTWIQRYNEGCMHTSLESAKKWAEIQRVRGTVFYIKQLPTLYIQIFNQNLKVFLTQINTNDPLFHYEYKRSFRQDIDKGLGHCLDSFIESFRWYSSFWSKTPNSENSLIFVCHDPETEVNEIVASKLRDEENLDPWEDISVDKIFTELSKPKYKAMVKEFSQIGIDPITCTQPKAFKSYSRGSDYYLDWEEFDPELTTIGVESFVENWNEFI